MDFLNHFVEAGSPKGKKRKAEDLVEETPKDAFSNKIAKTESFTRGSS